MNLAWFAQILVHHPFVILIAVAVFSCTCLIIPFTLEALPNFSDPQMGFETRGTILANRRMAWKNLEEATRPSGPFSVNPKDFIEQRNGKENVDSQRKKMKPKERKKHQNAVHIFVNDDITNHSRYSLDKIKWKTLRNLTNLKFVQHNLHPLISDGFFCGPPDEGYAHVVLEANDASDLFTYKSIEILCRLEHELMEPKHFRKLCIETVKKPKRCCRAWSLANYIAILHDRTSCLAITEDDLNSTKALLQRCSQYYHSLQLAQDCSEKGYCNVPLECIQHDAVFNILNFITSTSFLPPNKSSVAVLKETMIFIPLASSIATMPYFHELENMNLEFNGISVVAMDLGIKGALFDKYLIQDAWFMSAGVVFVLFCIWLYTESLFLTLMTITAIAFSLGISYFLYTLVFELRFFPFMNMLATIVAIGIGADDAFIFCKVWHTSKQEKNSCTVKTMSDTFYHAFISMFVTSLTTATAFFASYTSSITAVCCFSIFAAMAVIANFVIMIFWLPACMVVWEDWCGNCNLSQSGCCFLRFLPQCGAWLHCKYSSIDKLWNNKVQILVDAVLKFRWFSLVVLSGVAAGSAVIVLYYPKLKLPNAPDFPLFDSSHPFEKYDLHYKNMFWFERAQKTYGETNTNYKLPLRFVWGVVPVDNGDYLDPQSLGKLELDPNFDVSTPESQAWLLHFCKQIRRQPFYQPTLGPLLPNCFIESFMSWMQRRCLDPIDKMDRTPCCESQRFPYNSTVFNTCIVLAMTDLYETPSEYFIPGMAGPKFSKDKFPTIKAIVVEYDSRYSFSMSYELMHEFFTKVEEWTKEQLKSAPATMQRGWFVSELEFYDLQQVLSKGTLVAIGVSMGLALTVLLLATLNIPISLFAILTITCSILVTMAVLVLLGWKLNVLESIAVSTTIGLTVDFSLHYAVNYRLCLNKDDRKIATRYALVNMAGPASMAALTTGAAGLFMIPSSIVPYIQIGIFLITVMSVSWVFATFHLCSLLAIAGPQKHFGQLYYSKLVCCTAKTRNSTSTERRRHRPVSSSLSDTHEMDCLASKSGMRLGNRTLQRSLSGGKSGTNRHFADQSPSATSAITIIMVEDN